MSNIVLAGVIALCAYIIYLSMVNADLRSHNESLNAEIVLIKANANVGNFERMQKIIFETGKEKIYDEVNTVDGNYTVDF